MAANPSVAELKVGSILNLQHFIMVSSKGGNTQGSINQGSWHSVGEATIGGRTQEWQNKRVADPKGGRTQGQQNPKLSPSYIYSILVWQHLRVKIPKGHQPRGMVLCGRSTQGWPDPRVAEPKGGRTQGCVTRGWQKTRVAEHKGGWTQGWQDPRVAEHKGSRTQGF
jgi:hypothetical protein